MDFTRVVCTGVNDSAKVSGCCLACNTATGGIVTTDLTNTRANLIQGCATLSITIVALHLTKLV